MRRLILSGPQHAADPTGHQWFSLDTHSGARPPSISLCNENNQGLVETTTTVEFFQPELLVWVRRW